MKRGVKFVPEEVKPVCFDPVLGVPIVYDPSYKQLAKAVGVWPWKRIVVGTQWMRLGPRTQVAVALHEVGHCRSLHLEVRLLLLAAAIVPILLTVPPLILLGLLCSACVWAFAEWYAGRQEFIADAFVVKHGFGVEFAQMLRNAGEHDSDLDPFHPSHAARIERITKLLQESLHEVA
jgi:Zn-dependent protease with chaperone function